MGVVGVVVTLQLALLVLSLLLFALLNFGDVSAVEMQNRTLLLDAQLLIPILILIQLLCIALFPIQYNTIQTRRESSQ